ncbi:GAF domain-containing protein [Leptolyngbya sp. 7M]|uniref:GAF domain-containing protein n=1 Tax=Leptolyngbya sp. 7M TaxID=2812896 RepID=UPI001B8D9624|nr:GAF domain-containing protein [Leptolyngbya sp. 7M]QYO63262.1 GAF domain-containing protein [Leptolyngbya sp. 7M]
MSNQSLAQLQEENYRLVSERNQVTAECERLQAELTDLQSRLQICEQSATNLHDDRSSALEHRLLEATAIAANSLLTIANFDQVVNTALQILGEVLETDRVKILECVFEDPSHGSPTYYTMSYEWITEGTISQISHPSSSCISIRGAEMFMENLYQNDGFGGLLNEWPELFWNAFEAVQAKATYCVPIRVEGQLWGALVFDDCREAKHRNLSQLAVLKIAANCIGSAIERQRTQQALQAEQARSQELERLNTELQQTLDRLAESERRYRTLFELSSEGIVRFGYRQPIPLTLSVDEQLNLCYQSIYIAEANDAYAKMLECEKAEDLIGTTLNDFHDRNSEVTQATMRSWIENRYFCRQLETVEFDRQGRNRQPPFGWCSTEAEPVNRHGFLRFD